VAEQLKSGVESFAKSVAKRDKMDSGIRDRLVAAAEAVAKDVRGDYAGLAGLAADPDAQSIEVMKKLKGQITKVGEEYARTVLHLHPRLAPVAAAVFPLKKNEPALVEMARGLRKELQGAGVRAVYDDTGAIGKLYRRQDEIGTPWCLTVDFQSLEDQTVTIRDRDSMQQERVPVANLASSLLQRMR